MTHTWQAPGLESPAQTLLGPGFDGQTKTLMGGTLGFVHSAPYPGTRRGTMLGHGCSCIASEGKHWGNML